MKLASIPDEEDLLLVKEFILLPIILDVLERDIKLLALIPLKMPTIYIKSFRGIQDQITLDLFFVQKQIRKRGIKVYDQRRTKLQVEAEYLCRGYHHSFKMLWGLVKAEVEQKLGQYMHIDLTATE